MTERAGNLPYPSGSSKIYTMPVDYTSIQQQIRSAAANARRRQMFIEQKKSEAQELFDACTSDPEELLRRAREAIRLNPRLRTGLPGNEALTLARSAPALPERLLILAADGSQIQPDRHAPVEFGLINVGIYRLAIGSSQPPREIIHSKLLDWDDLNPPEGRLNEEIIALERDLSERRALALQAQKESDEQPGLLTVSLTDGPLELYGDPKEQRLYEEKFRDYLKELRSLALLGSAVAGYVDKPRADLVIRLLELMTLPEEELSKAGNKRPLAPVTDRDLFQPRLGPGERSPVFQLNSSSAAKFTGDLALHFFYLNVGSVNKPWLARVEVPAWVANDPQQLDTVHAVLVDQAQWLGSKPYPYALHRAHETALVTFDEKRQLLDLMARELLSAGLSAGESSYKQQSKDLSGTKQRYG